MNIIYPFSMAVSINFLKQFFLWLSDALPKGLEPLTYRSRNERSAQLSYGSLTFIFTVLILNENSVKKLRIVTENSNLGNLV